MNNRARALLVSLLLICSLDVSCTSALLASQRSLKQPSQPKSTAPHDEFAVNRNPLQTPLVKPRIVISKSKRRLMLYSDDKLVRIYRIGLGTDPVNDKVREGDRRTPEGNFYIFTKNDHSSYYLSLGLSYPNIEDAERGFRDRLINRRQYEQIVAAIRSKDVPLQNTALGGEIYIHGNGSQTDWTWGCVALDDNDIRELFGVIPVKTPVLIEH